jgi:hypothetical protein
MMNWPTALNRSLELGAVRIFNIRQKNVASRSVMDDIENAFAKELKYTEEVMR